MSARGPRRVVAFLRGLGGRGRRSRPELEDRDEPDARQGPERLIEIGIELHLVVRGMQQRRDQAVAAVVGAVHLALSAVDPHVGLLGRWICTVLTAESYGRPTTKIRSYDERCMGRGGPGKPHRVKRVVIAAAVSLALGLAGPAPAGFGLCGGRVPTMVGDDGDNTLRGTGGDDVITGGGGRDTILGGGGHDTVCGDGGGDYLHGGFGEDAVYGEAGTDHMRGGPAGDRLYGGPKRDAMHGGEQNDAMRGGPARDVMNGGGNDDDVSGDRGNDLVNGNRGNDHLHGAGGDDDVYGGRAADTLYGGEGNDYLDGGGGVDVCRRGETSRSCP